MKPILNLPSYCCGLSSPLEVYFQDTATPQMEGLIELHDNIMYYLFIILFAVFWILVSIVRNYVQNKISNKYLNHGTLIELIWTISPAIILILIAFPSFKLLYLIDEVTDPYLDIYTESIHTLFMNNDVGQSSSKSVSTIVNSIAQRPESKLCWEMLEEGAVYYKQTPNNPLERLVVERKAGATIVFDKENPSLDVSKFMYNPRGDRMAFIERDGMMYHGWIIQRNNPYPNQDWRSFGVNYPKYLNHANTYYVTSGGLPVGVDSTGNIRLKKY